MYLGHLGQESISRIFLLGTGLFAIILVTSGRYFCRKFMNNYKIFQMPVIFIGAGLTAEMIIDYFKDDVGFGYRIIGFIDDAPVSKKIARRFRILGGFEQASSGRVLFENQDITDLPPYKRRINTVFQKYSLFHNPK